MVSLILFVAPSATALSYELPTPATKHPIQEKGESESNKNLSGQEDEFEKLTRQLGDSDYATRASATSKLIALGPTAIPAVVKAIGESTGEKRFRLRQVLKGAIADKDLGKYPNAIAAIATLKSSDEAWLKNIAIDILGPDPDIALSKDIVDWMEIRFKSERQNSFDEIYQQIKKSRSITTQAHRPNRKQEWRKLSDVAAKQHVLMYRIKWFNGHWSHWFIPGFNDANPNTPGKRQWNLFYDHEFEVITIKVTRGDFQNRDQFIAAAKKKLNRKPDEPGIDRD